VATAKDTIVGFIAVCLPSTFASHKHVWQKEVRVALLYRQDSPPEVEPARHLS